MNNQLLNIVSLLLPVLDYLQKTTQLEKDKVKRDNLKQQLESYTDDMRFYENELLKGSDPQEYGVRWAQTFIKLHDVDEQHRNLNRHVVSTHNKLNSERERLSKGISVVLEQLVSNINYFDKSKALPSDSPCSAPKDDNVYCLECANRNSCGIWQIAVQQLCDDIKLNM